MRQNMSGFLNPIKINHSSSFVSPVTEHSGTFNKNTEKIKMLELDLETSKDTLIKLKSELVNLNQEIKNLKYNNKSQNLENQCSIKVIETVLKLIDPSIYKGRKKQQNSNTTTYNTINHEIIGKDDEIRGEREKELTINISNLNKRNLKSSSNIIKTEKSQKKQQIKIQNIQKMLHI